MTGRITKTASSRPSRQPVSPNNDLRLMYTGMSNVSNQLVSAPPASESRNSEFPKPIERSKSGKSQNYGPAKRTLLRNAHVQSSAPGAVRATKAAYTHSARKGALYDDGDSDTDRSGRRERTNLDGSLLRPAARQIVAGRARKLASQNREPNTHGPSYNFIDWSSILASADDPQTEDNRPDVVQPPAVDSDGDVELGEPEQDHRGRRSAKTVGPFRRKVAAPLQRAARKYALADTSESSQSSSSSSRSSSNFSERDDLPDQYVAPQSNHQEMQSRAPLSQSPDSVTLFPFLVRNVPERLHLSLAGQNARLTVVYRHEGPRGFSLSKSWPGFCCPLSCGADSPLEATYQDLEKHLSEAHPLIRIRWATDPEERIPTLELSLPYRKFSRKRRSAKAPLGKGKNKGVEKQHPPTRSRSRESIGSMYADTPGPTQRDENKQSSSVISTPEPPADFRTSVVSSVMEPPDDPRDRTWSPSAMQSERSTSQSTSIGSHLETPRSESKVFSTTPKATPESREGHAWSFNTSKTQPLPSQLTSTESSSGSTPSRLKGSSVQLTRSSETSNDAGSLDNDFARRSSPNGYPDPPPPDNPFGPAARPPYCRPAPPGEPQIGLPYSCRPDGEKIYDILAELSLDEFGLCAHEVTDREEEIFDCDDLTDEMKSMYAIWARWIWWPKNRMLLLAKPQEALMAFFDKYWEYIHRCCGYATLQSFLVTLLVVRLLPIDKLDKGLQYYTTKTGMKHWAPVPWVEEPTQ